MAVLPVRVRSGLEGSKLVVEVLLSDPTVWNRCRLALGTVHHELQARYFNLDGVNAIKGSAQPVFLSRKLLLLIFRVVRIGANGIDQRIVVACDCGAVPELGAEGVVGLAEAGVRKAVGDVGLAGAQAIEVGKHVSEGITGFHLPDASAVEGDDFAKADRLGALGKLFPTQQVEGSGEVAAEAVAGRIELGAYRNLTVGLELGVPSFHVTDLAKGPAELGDFEHVRGLVVARTVVEKLGAAEADDVLLFCFVVKQRAAEACRGIGDVIHHGPFGNKFLGFVLLCTEF
jgi:hypothetical protein